FCFFFFQAEDGIRDRNVTGVQTCALPIYILIFNCFSVFLPIVLQVFPTVLHSVKVPVYFRKQVVQMFFVSFHTLSLDVTVSIISSFKSELCEHFVTFYILFTLGDEKNSYLGIG